MDATGIPRQSWILNSTPVDSGFQSSVVSGFLELCSGVQSPGFWIAWTKLSWYPDCTSKNFPGPYSLQWGDRGNLMLVSLATWRVKPKAEIKIGYAIIAQRLSEFETYHVWCQERLHMLTMFWAKKSSRYVERCAARFDSYGKWKNERAVCLQSELSQDIEQWIQSIRLWIWLEIGRG